MRRLAAATQLVASRRTGVSGCATLAPRTPSAPASSAEAGCAAAEPGAASFSLEVASCASEAKHCVESAKILAATLPSNGPKSRDAAAPHVRARREEVRRGASAHRDSGDERREEHEHGMR